MSFPRVKLSEIVDINPRTNVSALLQNSAVAFLAMADIAENGTINNIQERNFSELAKGYTVFQNGDVLLAKITPCFENGKAAVVQGLFSTVGFGSTEFHVLRPKPQLDSRFLFYTIWNQKFRTTGEQRMTGSAGQKRVPSNFLGEYEIALPPLKEQKRIAAILDKADSLRRKRQQAIQLADDFLRAVFIDMFGKVFNSDQKDWRTIGELTSFIDYRGKTPIKADKGVPLLTAKNVKNGYLDEEPKEFIPADAFESWMTRGFPRTGDVLFTTEAPLANVALLPKYEQVALAQRIICIQPSQNIGSEYLLFALQHPIVVEQILARATGSTVKGIRSKELVKVKIPTPDLNLQNNFGAIFRKMTDLKALNKSGVMHINSCKAALLGTFND